MSSVAEVIASKGNKVKSVPPDTEVKEAIKIMAKHGISSLLVIDNDKVLGIFCEKDFSCKIVVEDKLTEVIPVSQVMTSPVCAVRPDQSVQDAMSIMTEKRIRHLPVMDDEKLVGLVSIGDLVKSVMKEQKDTIDQLEHYIHY